jgi:hypothetical protein
MFVLAAKTLATRVQTVADAFAGLAVVWMIMTLED